MPDVHRWDLWKDGLASHAGWKAVQHKWFLRIVRYYREIIKRWSILLVMGMVGQRREVKGKGLGVLCRIVKLEGWMKGG